MRRQLKGQLSFSGKVGVGEGCANDRRRQLSSQKQHAALKDLEKDRLMI